MANLQDGLFLASISKLCSHRVWFYGNYASSTSPVPCWFNFILRSSGWDWCILSSLLSCPSHRFGSDVIMWQGWFEKVARFLIHRAEGGIAWRGTLLLKVYCKVGTGGLHQKLTRTNATQPPHYFIMLNILVYHCNHKYFVWTMPLRISILLQGVVYCIT